MKQAIVQTALVIQLLALVVMVVYILSRPGFRTLAKQAWKATGFRWALWVFGVATVVVLASRLLTTLGIG